MRESIPPLAFAFPTALTKLLNGYNGPPKSMSYLNPPLILAHPPKKSHGQGGKKTYQ